jgi:hypothetical protein
MTTLSGAITRTEVPVRIGYGTPNVSITSPGDGSLVYDGEAVEINVSADGVGAPLAGVEIYADGKRLVSLTSPPWSARWAVITGTHQFDAIAYTTFGDQARAAPVHVTDGGIRLTPTPTQAAIMWISNITEYKEIRAGINEVWVDVSEGSPVQHVDIYIDGLPAGFATGPGYRVNPSWTPTPAPSSTPLPTFTLEPQAAITATLQAATAEAQQTRVAVASATRAARAQATAKARAGKTSTAVAALAQTATVSAATASPTPGPPTNTATPTATPTFERFHKLLDPMLGDFVARSMFRTGRHRVTAIGYDQNNRQVARDEVWVVVK